MRHAAGMRFSQAQVPKGGPNAWLKWVAAAVIVVPLVVGFFFAVFHWIDGSDQAAAAKAFLSSSSTVRSRLGAPVSLSLRSGKIDGKSGAFTYAIEGPRGEGTAQVLVVPSGGGTWRVSKARLSSASGTVSLAGGAMGYGL